MQFCGKSISRLLAFRCCSLCGQTSRNIRINDPGLGRISFTQSASWAHLASYSTAQAYWGSFSRDNLPERKAYQSFPPTSETNNAWSFTTTSPVHQWDRCFMKGTRFKITDSLFLFKFTLVLNVALPYGTVSLKSLLRISWTCFVQCPLKQNWSPCQMCFSS
jgi:hypothetical protein